MNRIPSYQRKRVAWPILVKSVKIRHRRRLFSLAFYLIQRPIIRQLTYPSQYPIDESSSPPFLHYHFSSVPSHPYFFTRPVTSSSLISIPMAPKAEKRLPSKVGAALCTDHSYPPRCDGQQEVSTDNSMFVRVVRMSCCPKIFPPCTDGEHNALWCFITVFRFI